jgi:8-oxo-dGTP pyrophosphatase MutT (NUDIX family)
MIFNCVLGLQEINKEKLRINYRTAVRAVIWKDNKILMVHSNRGDYKFPGGGLNKDESHEEALKREVREETGYIINNVKDKIGVIIERKLDDYEENSIFEMTSYYYLCEITSNQTTQQLDDYEEELEFHPIWIGVDKAIELNEETLKDDNKEKNPWTYREVAVLKALKEYYVHV